MIALQREADHVEVGERRLALERVERQAGGAQAVGEVGPRREGALGGEVGLAVDDVVEDLEPVVAHADGIGVGVDERDAAAQAGGILADLVHLAADVPCGRLHAVAERSDAVEEIHGVIVKEKRLRKVLLAFALVAGAVALPACGSGNSGVSTTDPAQPYYRNPATDLAATPTLKIHFVSVTTNNNEGVDLVRTAFLDSFKTNQGLLRPSRGRHRRGRGRARVVDHGQPGAAARHVGRAWAPARRGSS